MAHAGMSQVDQQLPGARGGRLSGLDLGADMAWLVIDDRAILRRDLFDGSHRRSFFFSNQMEEGKYGINLKQESPMKDFGGVGKQRQRFGGKLQFNDFINSLSTIGTVGTKYRTWIAGKHRLLHGGVETGVER